MIRAFQMVFVPEWTWLRIAEKNRGFLFVFFVSTVPLIAGALALEAFGLLRLGETVGEFGKVTVAQHTALKYVGMHGALDLGFLFFGGWFLLSVARSFNARVGFPQAFSTLAYGASPIFLTHALDGLPFLYSWLCWGIGFGLAIRSLYHGVAINMKPEQTKGFGLYIVSIFIVGLLSALAHYVSLAVLHGKVLR